MQNKPMDVAALIKDLQALPQAALVFRLDLDGLYKPFTRTNIQFDGPNVIIY